jgi:hypothetical protein
MPLLTLKQLDVTPPGYWHFPRYPDADGDDIPAERRYIIGGDFQDLVKRVAEFRIINSLPLGKPEEEISDWICRHTEAPCRPANPPEAMPGRKARGADVARFLMAMGAWMKHGGHVSQEEADRRSETCGNCQFRTTIDDGACFGCFGLMAKVMAIIGNRKARFADEQSFCGVCGCNVAAQAWVPIDILARAHKLEDFPEDTGNGTPCWKKPL